MNKEKLLQINLLGNPKFQWGNDPISLKRKSLAVIIYLARQKEPIRRKELVSLIWPNSNMASGLRSLTSLLWRLPIPIKESLRIERERIQFKAENVRLDIHQFEQNLKYVDQVWHHEKTLKKTARSLLEQTVNLYQGAFLENYYLADHIGFMSWLVQEQRYFEKQAFAASHRLFLYYYEQSKLVDAIRLVQEMLRIRPFEEDAHMVLMKLLVENNDVDQAIEHYQSFQVRLSKELNATPSSKIITYYQELYLPTLVPLERRMTAADLTLLRPMDSIAEKNELKGNFEAKVNSVPQVIVKLFGRDQLIAQLKSDITAASNRLISLTGLGGIGKTQLALSVGNLISTEFKDGVLFIPLRNVKRDPLMEQEGTREEIEKRFSNHLAITTLSHMKIPINQDIPPFFQLIESLGQRELLLIYDNFEHLMEGAPFFTTLLHAVAEITILITSRIRLNQQGEFVIRVPPLKADENPLEEGQHPRLDGGVQLFVDRATRLNQKLSFGLDDLAAIQTICNLTGGLPLAIEQAASWVTHYSLAEIIKEIQRSYDFLEDHSLPLSDPHRSIRLTLDSSYHLLTKPEQQMLQTLTLFHNVFSRQAALFIADESISVLVSLVNHSLIQQVEPSWYSLHPLVAQMVKEKQEQDDQFDHKGTQKRFVSYFLSILAKWRSEHTMYKTLQAAQITQMEHISEDVFQAWKWGVTNQAYCLLATAVTGLKDYIERTNSNFLSESIFNWTYQQLTDQVPDHQKQVELLPVCYLDVLLPVMWLMAYNLYQNGSLDEAEETYIKVIQALKHSSKYNLKAFIAMELASFYALQGRVEEGNDFMQLAQEQKRFVTDLIVLGKFEIELTYFYYWKNQYDKAMDHVLTGIGLFENREGYEFHVANFYNWMAKIALRKDHFTQAIQIVDSHLAIEKNIHPIVFRMGQRSKAESLLLLGRAAEALEIHRSVENEVRSFGIFIEVRYFYELAILILLELNFSKNYCHQSLADLVVNAQKIIQWVEKSKIDASPYVYTSEAVAYASEAAGYALSNQMFKAKHAFGKTLAKLSLLSSEPNLDSKYIKFLLIMISFYLIQTQQLGLFAKFISYLQMDGSRNSQILHKSYERLKQMYEGCIGTEITIPSADFLKMGPQKIVRLILKEFGSLESPNNFPTV